MIDYKVVIGSNFGDEGKGLMTDYFAEKAITNEKSCLVVCTNGGAQRGHTVVTPSGVRHVFSHFGSGTLAGAETYLPENYIINPMIFRKEYEQLKLIGITPKCYINENCRVTLPFDMLINQITEDDRGDQRHGSCGMGIWETIVRNRMRSRMVNVATTVKILWDDAYNMRELIDNIKTQYLPARLINNGVVTIPLEKLQIINNPKLIDNFIDDWCFMSVNTTIINQNDVAGLFNKYDVVIFENAQGLALDNDVDETYSTPSQTGLQQVLKMLEYYDLLRNNFNSLEACYVSRTYLTKHGAGDFPEEVSKESLNPSMVDLTNIPNHYQGTLRYGNFAAFDLGYPRLLQRLSQDWYSNFNWEEPDPSLHIYRSFALTHMNEYIDKIPMMENIITTEFTKIYTSDGMTRSSVKEYIKENK